MSLPFILLIIANCFMTLAWYGHLKFLPGVPLWQAILF
ncbi:MAG: DMT family protein, partial [Acinetobacter sp.]|nr:DMT family protein [Acinetobacter sp.]MDN5715581.1 DMT family protein [Acinetobacter sp.]